MRDNLKEDENEQVRKNDQKKQHYNPDNDQKEKLKKYNNKRKNIKKRTITLMIIEKNS